MSAELSERVDPVDRERPATEIRVAQSGRKEERVSTGLADRRLVESGVVTSYACRVSRYGKRADMVVHEDEPFNAKTGLAALAEGPLTATDAFCVRGHAAVPEIDPVSWQLHVHRVSNYFHLGRHTADEGPQQDQFTIATTAG